MSKGETLRGFVTERLSAVSREILAVVDGIVAEYEAEASGFREEIDRQRKQLEEAANKTDGKSNKRLLEEEKCDEEDNDDDDDDEDESQEVPTNTNPSRTVSGRGRFKKRRPSRPPISETQNHIVLRIRILEDPKTSVLSNNILKKSPLLKLSCPPGLQEKDFLDLLRSAVPQLSGDHKHFDLLTSDQRRRLEPLKLTAVTPEEICRLTSHTESKKSPIYVRLKESQANQDETDPRQKKDSPPSSAVLVCDESRLQITSPAQEGAEVSGSSTSRPEDMGTGEGNENEGGIPEPHEDLVTISAAQGKVGDSDPAEDKRDVNESDDDWKPDKDVEELKESDSELFSEPPKRQKPRRSGVKTNEKRAEDADVLTCRGCAASQKSEVALVKHAWIHVEDSETLCGVCGELSASVEELEEHLAINHRTDDCDVCGETFLDDASFNEHVAAHSGEKPYGCDICSERFALTVSLENHRKVHEAEKLHKCHTCNKVFELRSQLKAHRMTHTHLCGVCGKSLSDYRSLSRHKMTHTGERPHSCKVCGRSFKLPGTLRQHEKIHTDRERTYLCDVCCKMFLTSKQLQIHMRTHTNEKPYHCGECGKGFTTKGPLTVHMRVHTGEAPYRCPDCGWSFKRKVHLDNHVTVHSDLKPFVCGICGKACARKVYLKVHMRTHNGERPYKCNLCDKAFTQSHCLKTHMKSHLVTDIAT